MVQWGRVFAKNDTHGPRTSRLKCVSGAAEKPRSRRGELILDVANRDLLAYARMGNVPASLVANLWGGQVERLL